MARNEQGGPAARQNKIQTVLLQGQTYSVTYRACLHQTSRKQITHSETAASLEGPVDTSSSTSHQFNYNTLVKSLFLEKCPNSSDISAIIIPDSMNILPAECC